VRILIFLATLISATPVLAAAPSGWAQDQSDLAADPSVLFGTLPNGLRYAVKRNVTPPGQVSVRLQINAGSMMESQNQAGIAHFLEHMAFRGSSHIKDGEVFKRLERLGAAPGADTNAATGYDSTAYQFDLPKNDQGSIDEALLQLREIASELRIDAKAAATERNVVLSEERMNDTPDGRLSDRAMQFFYRGLPLGAHMPIGRVEDVRQVTPEQIRIFYRQWYRPERAALVVTGDIDPQRMELEIRHRFSDWQGQGPAAPDLERGTVISRAAETETYSEAGLPTCLSIAWISATNPAIRDDKKEERAWMLRNIALGAFNRRLADLAQGADAPFLGASLSASTDFYKTADQTSLDISTSNDGWERGLKSVVGEWRKALRDGFTPVEIDRQLRLIRRNRETVRDGAATRQTPGLADGLLSAISSETVFRSPDQKLALFQEMSGTVDKAEIDAAFATLFATGEPLLFAGSPAPLAGLTAAYDRAMAAPAPPAVAAEPEKVWSYTDFGARGRVVERREEADIGVTFVTFANGVHLTIKPTRFRDNEILTAATFGNGLAGEPNAHFRQDLLSGVLLNGGLKTLSAPEISKLMADKVAGLAFDITDDRFVLGGRSRPKDFDFFLQRMAAQIIAPGWRAEGLEQTKARYKPWLEALDTTLDGALYRHSADYLMKGDPRWAVPSTEQLSGASLADAHALLDRALAEDYLELTVVGRIEPDQVIEAVAKTIGALPARKPYRPLPASALAVSLTQSSTPIMVYHHGRADQAFEQILWPTTDRRAGGKVYFDLRMAQSIISQRLFDQFRAKAGASYSPGADSYMSQTFPSYGYFSASTETPPDKIPLFESTLAAIIADLKTHPVGKDEFERARKPFIEEGRAARQTNGYWLSALEDAQIDPFQLEVIRHNSEESWNAETPEAVQKAIQTYLIESKALRVKVLAEPQQRS
jgi:zinc protease